MPPPNLPTYEHFLANDTHLQPCLFHEDSEKKCPLCLLRYNDRHKPCLILSCHHQFGFDCLDEFFKTTNTCPVCHKTLFQRNDYQKLCAIRALLDLTPQHWMPPAPENNSTASEPEPLANLQSLARQHRSAVTGRDAQKIRVLDTQLETNVRNDVVVNYYAEYRDLQTYPSLDGDSISVEEAEHVEVLEKVGLGGMKEVEVGILCKFKRVSMKEKMKRVFSKVVRPWLWVRKRSVGPLKDVEGPKKSEA